MESLKRLSALLAFLAMSVFAFAQNQPISGKVTDANGNGLVGINILIKGTRKGTATNTDGSFTINAPTNATLVVSGIGFADQEIALDGRTDVSISLTGRQSELNTVVITALGITKAERKVGYSVTAINGDQLNKARETNVALSLEGQVAGLDVHGTSGGPGGTARILLRGMPSMNSAGSPLFVIDGVPIDNSNRGGAGEWGGADLGDGIGNLNPDDIETMTVLKGQSASALYGPRAINGVIIVTTKKGKKGKATVEFNTNNVADAPINYADYQYVYGQGQNGVKPANSAAAVATNRFSWGSKMDGSPITQYNGKTYAYSPAKDNFKNFYRTGSTFTNTVSVSGGNDKGTYRLSLSNLNNNANVINSGIGRKTINLNLDQKVTDRLSVSVMANYIDEEDKNKQNLSDGPLNANNFLFLASSVDENIFKPGYDSLGNEIVFSDDNYVTNPWFVTSKFINNTGRKRLITAITPKFNFTDWLYVAGRLAYDHENDRYYNVTPTGTNYSINAAGQSGGFGLSNAQTTEMNLDAYLGISHKLTRDINLDATLGGSDRKTNFESIGIGGSNFVIPFLYTPTNVVSFNRSYSVSNREVHSAYYSLDFSYRNFLTLTTTGRYDAFSTLYFSGIPKKDRNIFTPSVSGSFLFSELLHAKDLTYGKLRASYAQTSGEPSTPYQTAVYYGVGNAISYNGSAVPTGNFSSTLPNLFLKPFTKTEIEVGTELKFLDNRLGFDIAYFNQKTHNEIMNANLSSSTGYGSTVIANGSVQNNGLEVQVTGTPVRTRTFNWNITFNFTTVKNKILKTDAGGNNVRLGQYRPLNANTAFIKGLSGPQIQAHDYTYDSKGGIVVDPSGLPIRGGLINMGSVLPTQYGGLRNDFNFGNVNFSFLVDYNFGNKILSATSYYSILRGLNKNTLPGRETGITMGVTAAGAPNTVAADAQSYYQRLASISRGNVLNGDYIKLRQLTLGYTINEKMLGNIPVFNAITVSLVARNLWTIMKKSDNIDPEAGFNASVSYAGIEGTSLPSTRTYGINVNFKFKN